ncbi:DEAD/DEAH box helicase [Flavobacteriales bacterium]|nr:DEAD/DEAH box helicase [Flavobacteriales bacterium]
MLALHQAQEIRKSLVAYLRTTFDFRSTTMREEFADFVQGSGRGEAAVGLFRGPYVSVRLPFVTASDEDQKAVPLEVRPPWPGYAHQVEAWNRLSTRVPDREPLPTLVTTGTGSGKTEAFLYPVLDHCLRAHSERKGGRPGIKVIILYPMNALATDQAKRLAEAIHEDDRLRGKVTAGLFIGTGNKEGLRQTMGEDHVVEHRDTILDAPPDILLTNFKMLDYGLMRSRFQRLWRENLADPDQLKFIVLDELHTYDGAQGTDVANLLRRVKLKLGLTRGQVCPVGTSATLGSGPDAPRLLAEFAGEVFGEEIDRTAVIGETRQSLSEFFGDADSLDVFLPRPVGLRGTRLEREEHHDAFVDRLCGLWQLNRDSLGEELRGLRIVHDLAEAVGEEPGVHAVDVLIYRLVELNVGFAKLGVEERLSVLESLLALISAAKVDQGGRPVPFLFVSVQLWMRELSGITRALTSNVEFRWRDQELDPDDAPGLPPWVCRDCGTTGWLAVREDYKECFEGSAQQAYDGYFTNARELHYLLPVSAWSKLSAHEAGYDVSDSWAGWIQPGTLDTKDDKIEDGLEVFAARKLSSDGRKSEPVCPCCQGRDTMAILGTRVATMTSIAINQVLSSNLELATERERKVLAFTNSVQDAAHQAGFIESRNYRFTLRSSIQKVLGGFSDPVTLADFTEAFIQHWRAHSDEGGTEHEEAYYHRFFPKDRVGRSRPGDYKTAKGYIPTFAEEFDRRVRWEVASEFGYDALLGRTLEKTGCAGVAFDAERIKVALDAMAPWREENMQPGQVDDQGLNAYVHLLLHRVRTRTAFDHPYLGRYREGKYNRNDLNWHGTDRYFLLRWFGGRSRYPRLFAAHKDAAGEALTTHSRKGTNWFHDFFKRSFPMANEGVDFVNEFHVELLDRLAESGVLEPEDGTLGTNYVLSTGATLVEGGVTDYRCDSCGHEVHVAMAALSLEGGSCHTFRCTGHYSEKPDSEGLNYYQLVYNRERSPRIHAKDHTGLLDRKAREGLERDFKSRASHNAPNVIVSTSTLEMGIDIGSLNVAFNTSVPPAPANFLQRVGRAGRSSGTALILNYATGKAHDRFYFDAPLEMMAGTVSTPGCFLSAQEILRRHFIAFCIDTWTGLDPDGNDIPTMVRFIGLEQGKHLLPEFFMNRLVGFIESEGDLMARFKAGYQGEVNPDVFDRLEEELRNRRLLERLESVAPKLASELQGLQQMHDAITVEIAERGLGEEDDERKALEREQKDLRGMKFLIKKRQVLEHLTNLGLLPNYAFPETGVTLNARVFRQVGQGGVRDPLNLEFELHRSAEVALRELAPGNVFYSQGYEFGIDGLLVQELSGNEELKRSVRFCSRCDHQAPDLNQTASQACPKCGDDRWQDLTNRQEIVRLQSVRSATTSSRATVTDHREERLNLPFRISRHFTFDEETHLGGWVLPEVPFGYEFFRKVTVLDVNLGQADSRHQDKIMVNEREAPRHGFITCKSCGKSHSKPKPSMEAKEFHYGYCPQRDKVWSGVDDEQFHHFFLFREMETEALRVLLPVHDMQYGADITHFRAGLELGLKRYFKGNPQHVQFSDHKEFNRTTGQFDRYVVMTDRVPGGTGYLERLAENETFQEVIRLALEALEDCPCQLTEKRGCNHCVYSYSNQAHQPDLSRKRAEELFRNLFESAGGWQKRVDMISGVTDSGRIEESELERDFIRLLGRWAGDEGQAEWSWAEEKVEGVVEYRLRHQTEDVKLHWRIRPQVDLRPEADGVEYWTRPDFLIEATVAERNGVDVLEAESGSVIPSMAIFMDGFQYHASAAHNRFAGDVQKRLGLLGSGKYLSWTLTWDDLRRFERAMDWRDDAAVGSALTLDALTIQANMPAISNSSAKLRRANRVVHAMDLSDVGTNMERLMAWLSVPFPKAWLGPLSLYLSGFQRKLFHPSFSPSSGETAMEAHLDAQENYGARQKTMNCWIPCDLPPVANLAEWRLLANPSREAEQPIVSRVTLSHPEEIEKEEWNTFWSVFNLAQFGEVESRNLVPSAALPMRMAADISAPEWDVSEVKEMYPEYAERIDRLHQEGQLQSEEDEKLLEHWLSDGGDVLAEADFIDRLEGVYFGARTEASSQFLQSQGLTPGQG